MVSITAERVALPETCLYLRPGRFAFNNRLCDSLFRLITQELMFPVAEIAGTRTQQQCRPYNRFHTHLPLKPNICYKFYRLHPYRYSRFSVKHWRNIILQTNDHTAYLYEYCIHRHGEYTDKKYVAQFH